MTRPRILFKVCNMPVLANTIANTISSPFQHIGRIVWTPALTEKHPSQPPLPLSLCLYCSLLLSLSSHLVPKGEMLRNGVHFSLYPIFCLEIPDAITNDSPLQKDDNLGLRGCITENARICLRRFFPHKCSNSPFTSASLHPKVHALATPGVYKATSP